jgi:hypothetical protein
MKAESSLVRNDKAPTRSLGTSRRLMACALAASANSSSMLANPARGGRESVPGDRVRPGEIALISEFRGQSARKPNDTAFARDIVREPTHDCAESG